MKKRFTSLFMALVMLISMIQISAFAAGESSEMQIYKQAGNDVYYEYDAANNTLGLARNAATSIADTIATNLMNNPFGVLGGVKNGKTANTTPGKTTSAAGKNLNYVAR